MASSIAITQDTVVKILIRRGTNAERQSTTLTEGELGYTIDTQRLYIGDGITQGGIPIGNTFLGLVANKNTYSSIAHTGDTIYQLAGVGGSTGSEVLYARTADGWEDIHPKFYSGITNGIFSLEKATDGKWRVTSKFIGGDEDEAVPSGLTVTYDDTDYPLMSLSEIPNRIDFDARYLSLTPDVNYPYTNSSFYFGNIKAKLFENNLDATVNVGGNLFINSNTPNNLHQIRFYTSDPVDTNASAIKQYYGTSSNVKYFKIGAQERLVFTISDSPGFKLEKYTNTNTLVTTFSSRRDGAYGYPNFKFYGTSRFYDPVFFDTGSDVTILGNLSVFGDITYLESMVTTTSAMSVINCNPNDTALVVAQLNYPGVTNQTIAKFIEGQWPYTNLAIRERQFVGINVSNQTNYETTGNNFVVSGSCSFGPHPAINPYGGGFSVYHNFIDLKSFGDLSLTSALDLNLRCGTGGNLHLSAGDSGFLEIQGGLRASGDVVAFSSSDERIKNNVKPIQNALEKLNQISGISFDWNEKSEYSGHDYGVIAQEVEQILPEIVTTRPSGYKAVRYEKIIPLLIEAIKELDTKYGNR